MLERIPDLPDGLLGLRAKGTVSKDDYDHVLLPLLEEARSKGQHMRFLYHLGPEFTGFTASGMWEDARIGLRFLRLFERCAIVSDVNWIRGVSRVVVVILPCPVRIFSNAQWQQAVEWLSSPAECTALTHRLLPERGVLVVEPHGKLRSEDFDALAMIVDPWIEAHGELHGLVIHVPEFPGWQSLSSFIRHIRFVRNHHRHIRHIALAADSKLAELGSGLAKHFVKAEIRRFDYKDIDRAIEWASRSPGMRETQQV